jgi:alpha-L-fucosidase 2
MRYPAGWHGDMWREAMPVGNGEIGGLVYGGVHKEIISVIHGKLWEGSIDKELPDVSYILPEIRKYLSENKPIEAEYLMRDELKKLGYKVSVAKPLPLCDLIITQKNQTGFTNYRRQLNMETAEASVTCVD